MTTAFLDPIKKLLTRHNVFNYREARDPDMHDPWVEFYIQFKGSKSLKGHSLTTFVSLDELQALRRLLKTGNISVGFNVNPGSGANMLYLAAGNVKFPPRKRRRTSGPRTGARK